MSRDPRAAGAPLADQGVEVALSALDRHAVRNGPLTIALQWLALNRTRLHEIVRLASAAV
jgi:hypothetical protein